MKRKFVLRLLAGVMAATLVVTGVPGTALTGIAIESVYAADGDLTVTSGQKTITITAGTLENTYYAVEKKATYEASGYGQTELAKLTWKKASSKGENITFEENLTELTEYYVLKTTDISGTITATKAKVNDVDGGTIKTTGIDIAGATVVLDQTSYTYSIGDITPKVKSITVDKTTITGSDITKYFTIGTLKDTVAAGTPASFDITAKTNVTGQKYSGTKEVTGVTVTALDLSSTAAAAYISGSDNGVRTALTPETYGADGGVKKDTASNFYVYAENSTDPLTVTTDGTDEDYYLTYDNISAAGTATVTVHGINNYTGTISATYKINKTASNDIEAPDVVVTPKTDSIVASIDGYDATTDTNAYEFSIATTQNPANRTWVDATNGSYTFTTCDGSALVAGTTYYVIGRIKATANTEASKTTTGTNSITSAEGDDGYTLATGDLSKATVTLYEKGSTTKTVTNSTYTYSNTVIDPDIVVNLNGTKLQAHKDETDTGCSGYTVKYAYITYNDKGEEVVTYTGAGNDGSDKPKAAGTVRVFIIPSEDSTLCGEKTIDFVIAKRALSIKVTLGEGDDTKSYDGTKTLTTTADTTLEVTATEDPEKTELGSLKKADAGKLVLNLSGSDVGTQTVSSINYDGVELLKNYAVTFSNLSELRVTVKQSTVTFMKKDLTNEVALGSSDNKVYYGKPYSLNIANTAGLKQTYTVVTGYEDYISVDENGVVTVKKYEKGITPQVKVSVTQEETKNYNSKNTDPKTFTLELNQASVTVDINGGEDKNSAYNLSVRPDATEADILKALNVTLSYNDSEADESHNKVITLDTTNSSVVYTNSTTKAASKVKPTEAGTYDVVVTYTGADAAYLDYVASTDCSTNSGAIKLTIDPSADSLTDAESSKVSTAPVIKGDTTFTGAAVVTITADGTIYYTTDGTAPTTKSTKYTDSFAITSDTTVKAIAVEEGKEASTVATASFTKKVTEDDPEEQLKAAQKELEKANADLEEAQKAAQKAESAKADAVKEAEKAATAAAEKAAADKIAAAEKAQKDAEDKAAAAEKAKTEAQAAQKAAEDKAAAAAATKVGDTVKVDGNTYKVTNVKSKTVSFAKVKKNAKTVNIVSSVEINGVTYKVTSIAASAFKGDKKLTSVTIPSTVKTIGANAFNGCTKLKTITINSSKITKIGSKAFSGVSKKAVVKAPSKKVKAYKKLLKKAKFTGSVKKA